jgi:hypothetical protein
LLSLLRRGKYEREMEKEMRFHLEMQIEQNLPAGMASEEAHCAARRQFGNQTWLNGVSREMWSLMRFCSIPCPPKDTISLSAFLFGRGNYSSIGERQIPETLLRQTSLT